MIRRPNYHFVHALAGTALIVGPSLLSGCATGSASSFSQAPLFFSEASDSSGRIIGANEVTGEDLQPSVGFQDGSPDYVSLGGNAVLPVRAALGGTGGALAASVQTPIAAGHASAGPDGAAIGANTTIVPVSLQADLGGSAGGLAANVQTPIATAQASVGPGGAAIGAGTTVVPAAVRTDVNSNALGIAAKAGPASIGVNVSLGTPAAEVQLATPGNTKTVGVGTGIALAPTLGAASAVPAQAVGTTQAAVAALGSQTHSAVAAVAQSAPVGQTVQSASGALLTTGQILGSASKPAASAIGNPQNALLSTTAINAVRMCLQMKGCH